MGGPKKAKRSKRASPASDTPRPWPTRIAHVLLRVYAGAFFLATAHYKLVQPGYTLGETMAHFRDVEYPRVIEHAIAHPPVVLGVSLDAFAAFLRDVMLPGAPVFAPAILLFEALLGLCLVLGLGVRLMAGLGFLLMLAFTLAKPDPRALAEDPVGVGLFSVASANWPLTLILLVLCLVAAGRALGLDALLCRRGPPWLRWLG